MKQENKALQARLNREDKLRTEDEQKKEELDYINYQSQFRHRLHSVDSS